MTTSKLPRFEKPEVEKQETPVEVNNIKGLLSDNGWKLLIKDIDREIEQARESLEKPIPLGLTEEQTKVRYADLEKIKINMEANKRQKRRPYEILKEYGETEFEIDMSNEV